MLFKEFGTRVCSIIKGNSTKEINFHDLSLLLADLSATDLPYAIYLLQGRLGPPTSTLRRDKAWPTKENIYRKFLQIPFFSGDNTKYNPNIRDFYYILRELVIYDDISKLRADYINRLHKYIKCLDKANRKLLCLILTNRVIPDTLIIKVFGNLSDAGIGGERSLKRYYQTTNPDLGKIGLLLREKNYYDTVTSKPIFGILIPEENISTWESIHHAWEEIQPIEGLVIQGKLFEGELTQYHKKGNTSKLLKGNGLDISSNYPEIINQLNKLVENIDELIIDGQLLGLHQSTNSILPIRRYRKLKHFQYAVFDLYKLNQNDFRGEKYIQRRQELEKMFPVMGTKEADNIFLVEEYYANNLSSAEKLVKSFFSRPHYEGVIVKLPNGKCLSGQVSNTRGRIKPYTKMNVLLYGYNEETDSYPVGLWDDNNKERVIPFRVVESVEKRIKKRLDIKLRKAKMNNRPNYLGAGPIASWYIKVPIVVIIRWDGIVEPASKTKYPESKWTLHEGVVIIGIGNSKSVSKISILDSMKQAPHVIL